MAKRSLAKRRTGSGKSGEMAVISMETTGTVPVDASLAGHADRGLTLARLYDTGAYHLLRPDVRLRIFCDVLVSVVSLQASPRVRESGTPLGVLPGTIAIGLDGVSHLDLRSARRCGSGELELDHRYLAPEILLGERSGPAADVFALGVIGWEALTGARWTPPTGPARAAASGTRPARRPPTSREVVLREATVAGPGRGASSPRTPENASLQVDPTRWEPPCADAWPSDVEWARDFGNAMQRAMSPEPDLRPSNARSLLFELHWLDQVKLAAHREIADVMQGITKLSALYTPEPELPRADAFCQSGWIDRLATDSCPSPTAEACFMPPSAARRREPERKAPARPSVARDERPAPEPPAPTPQASPPKTTPQASASKRGGAAATPWMIMLWLLIAAASLVFGYLVSTFLRH